MIKLDKEKLTKLYKEEGWSISALTEEFKVGRETIKANIEFYNIILSAEDLITAKRFKEERKKQALLQKYGVDNVSKIIGSVFLDRHRSLAQPPKRNAFKVYAPTTK